MNFKDAMKKFWFLLWKDDSLKGWIFSIIFIFVFIKFIFFPGLSFVTGTELPLAIVESCSMYHQGNLISNYDSWKERHEAKYTQLGVEEELDNFRFKRGLNKGDILFIVGANPEKLEIGDVIVFHAGASNPVIHRIIDIREENESLYFSTIGDNNNGQLSFERNIPSENIIGEAKFRIAPYLGWIKLIFFESSKIFSERGFCDEN